MSTKENNFIYEVSYGREESVIDKSKPKTYQFTNPNPLIARQEAFSFFLQCVALEVEAGNVMIDNEVCKDISMPHLKEWIRSIDFRKISFVDYKRVPFGIRLFKTPQHEIEPYKSVLQRFESISSRREFDVLKNNLSREKKMYLEMGFSPSEIENLESFQNVDFPDFNLIKTKRKESTFVYQVICLEKVLENGRLLPKIFRFTDQDPLIARKKAFSFYLDCVGLEVDAGNILIDKKVCKDISMSRLKEWIRSVDFRKISYTHRKSYPLDIKINLEIQRVGVRLNEILTLQRFIDLEEVVIKFNSVYEDLAREKDIYLQMGFPPSEIENLESFQPLPPSARPLFFLEDETVDVYTHHDNFYQKKLDKVDKIQRLNYDELEENNSQELLESTCGFLNQSGVSFLVLAHEDYEDLLHDEDKKKLVLEFLDKNIYNVNDDLFDIFPLKVNQVIKPVLVIDFFRRVSHKAKEKNQSPKYVLNDQNQKEVYRRNIVGNYVDFDASF